MNMVSLKIIRILMGIIFFIVAFFCFTKPLESLINITIFFGIIAVIKGITYFILYFKLKRDMDNKEKNLIGLSLLNIIIGFIFLNNILVGSISLGYMFAIWVLFDAIMELSYSISNKSNNMFLHILSIGFCLLGIFIGGFMFLNPKIAMFSLTLISGCYFLSLGILEILLVFKLNNKE